MAVDTRQQLVMLGNLPSKRNWHHTFLALDATSTISCQLSRLDRSLTTSAASTFLRSFTNLPILPHLLLSLYFRRLYGGLACLDRIMRSSAQLIARVNIKICNYMLEIIHWLPIRQRMESRVASLV